MSFDRESFAILIEGDKELFASLLKLFEDDWPTSIDKIRYCLKQGQAKGVEEAAHRLKGNLRNFYATPAAQIAEKLENAGRGNHLANLTGMVDDLVQKIQQLQKELRQYLDEMT